MLLLKRSQAARIPIASLLIPLSVSALTTVYQWIKIAQENGVEGLQIKSSPGRSPRLSSADLVFLEVLLLQGAKAHGYQTNLWDSYRIAYIIEQYFGASYNPNYICSLLQKMGWSCQKPGFRSSERDEERIEYWRKVKFPQIQQAAEKRNGYLVFIDESGFMLTPSVARTWAPKGETPIEYIGDDHDRISAISAITVSPKRKRLGLLYHLLPDNMNFAGKEIAEFLCLLRQKTSKSMTLIWDPYSIHRAEPVENFLSRYPQILSELLPPHAPELNPTDQVWQHIKCARSTDYPSADILELRQFVEIELKRLQNRSDLLASFIRRTKLPVLIDLPRN